MKIIFALIIVLALASCRVETKKIKGIPKIVCTTTLAGDAARHIVGDKGEVSVLMGPGVDPHEYKEKPSDIDKLQEADIIIYHGLHLEGLMTNTLEKIKANKRPIIIDLSDALSPSDLMTLADAHGHTHGAHGSADPHIWNDIKLWIKTVNYLNSRLCEIKKEYKDEYQKNSDAFSKELIELDNRLTEQFNALPDSNRIVVTAHDAFEYLGRAYNLKLKSLQGFSTSAEFGIKDVTVLSDFIIKNKVKTIFGETSVPDRNLQAVIEHCAEKGHTVKLGGQLYSDALGDKKSGAETYASMMRQNANTIIDGLK